MATTSRQKLISASSSFVIFVTLIGVLSYIQVGDLHLASYVQQQFNQTYQQHKSTHETINNTNNSDEGVVQLDDVKSVEKNNTTIISREEGIYQAQQTVKRITKLYTQNLQSKQQQQQEQKSPACYPHFQVLSSTNEWTWSNITKFKRLYFYHARKAGGTSLAHYFSRVAMHHGLEFAQDEWGQAEEPGSHELPTFYVAHLREPVDRSISHFKYQGRWPCNKVIHIRRKDEMKFVPTEENALKIETWNSTGGHIPISCPYKRNIGLYFKLGECAVNCYTQWIAGLSCPEFNVSTIEQYQVAKTKLLRYNFIVTLEKLSDPVYANAIEQLFGVPGITDKRAAFCERTSHKANSMVPLTLRNETIERLTDLNEVDIGLYEELTDCLDDDRQNYTFTFPKWDAARFDTNASIQVHYNDIEEWKKQKRKKKQEAQDEVNITIVS